MDTITRMRLRAELRRDEGVRLKPYRDSVGKLTIGTGRNLEDVGISLDENEVLLNNDIRRVETELDTALPWWRTLDPVRQRVLAHMGFNLGLHRLLGFNHALRWMQQGQYDQAATAMLQSQWAKQVGPRAARLAHMMCSGHT